MKAQGGESRNRFPVELVLTNYPDILRAEDGLIKPDEVRRIRTQGVPDGSTNYLFLPKKVAAQLAVPVAGEVTVCWADRRKRTRPMVKGVEVELLGRRGVFRAIIEPRLQDIRIGAIILRTLDLVIDADHATLRPRDPNCIIVEIG